MLVMDDMKGPIDPFIFDESIQQPRGVVQVKGVCIEIEYIKIIWFAFVPPSNGLSRIWPTPIFIKNITLSPANVGAWLPQELLQKKSKSLNQDKAITIGLNPLMFQDYLQVESSA